MNESLIESWNKVVSPNDIVYHLGDVAFMSYEKFNKILHRLNGEINIILGNHDKMIIEHREDFLKSGKIKLIQDYKEIKIGNDLITMCHFPMRVWNGSHRGSISLHGHCHGTISPYGKSLDVGVDCKLITKEYHPISIEEVLEYMKNRPVEKPDYHEERHQSSTSETK